MNRVFEHVSDEGADWAVESDTSGARHEGQWPMEVREREERTGHQLFRNDPTVAKL